MVTERMLKYYWQMICTYNCYPITGLEFVARLIPSLVMKLSEEIARLSIILSIQARIEVQQDARIRS